MLHISVVHVSTCLGPAGLHLWAATCVWGLSPSPESTLCWGFAVDKLDSGIILLLWTGLKWEWHAPETFLVWLREILQHCLPVSHTVFAWHCYKSNSSAKSYGSSFSINDKVMLIIQSIAMRCCLCGDTHNSEMTLPSRCSIQETLPPGKASLGWSCLGEDLHCRVLLSAACWPLLYRNTICLLSWLL